MCSPSLRLAILPLSVLTSFLPPLSSFLFSCFSSFSFLSFSSSSFLPASYLFLFLLPLPSSSSCLLLLFLFFFLVAFLVHFYFPFLSSFLYILRSSRANAGQGRLGWYSSFIHSSVLSLILFLSLSLPFAFFPFIFPFLSLRPLWIDFHFFVEEDKSTKEKESGVSRLFSRIRKKSKAVSPSVPSACHCRPPLLPSHHYLLHFL